MAEKPVFRQKSGASDKLKAFNTRTQGTEAFLNRVVYPMYQEAQAKRFMTQGSSEGDYWPALNRQYAKWKLTRWASAPGSGRNMMVASGTLASNVIGPSNKFQILGSTQARKYHRKAVIPGRGLVVSLEQGGEFDYPKYANEERRFMGLSKATKMKMVRAWFDYFKGKEIPRG